MPRDATRCMGLRHILNRALVITHRNLAVSDISRPSVHEHPEIDSKLRRLARVCRMAEGGRRQKTVAHGDDPSPETKRRKKCQFISSFTTTYDSIGKSHRSTNYSYCGIDINIIRSEKNDVEEHIGTSGYGVAVRASKGSVNRSSFFTPESSQEGIEAATQWALFIAKHNVAFLVSDHVFKLFIIFKLFICSPTRNLPRISDARGQNFNATAIVKGLAPHYIKIIAVSLAPQPFSILMDDATTNLASFWSEHLMKNLMILGQVSSTCL